VLAILHRHAATEKRWPTIIESQRRILIPLPVFPAIERPEIVADMAVQVGKVLAAIFRVLPPAFNLEATNGTPQ